MFKQKALLTIKQNSFNKYPMKLSLLFLSRLSIVTIALLSHSVAMADRRWDDANNPDNLDPNYNHQFNQLPLNGEVDHSGRRGWADSYWPLVRGSIAERWQVKGADYKKESSPSAFQIINRMTIEQINLLSPAEKFDIVRGKFNYPIATQIRKDYKEDEKDWRGLCNGWTHSSLNYPEPKPIVFISPKNNIAVPFGSSDIKGLLAFYHAKKDHSRAKFIGRSCRTLSRILLNINGACTDVNPAAFHIMMANELGIKHRGFAADRDPSIQVWNQPFIKFESRIDNVKYYDLSKKASEETSKEIYVTSTLTYVNELYDTEIPTEETASHVAPSYLPVLQNQKTRTIEYQYVLEIDYRGNIIGGEWISGIRPDLIWKQDFELPGMTRDKDDKPDDWSMLAEIVKAATDGQPIGE